MYKNKKMAAGHHFEHQSPPMSWQDGFPLGNGFLGAMIWGNGHPLNITLDCADLWDNHTASPALDDPEYTYRNLCRLIKEQKYDEADAIFGGGKNAGKPRKLYPTKISIGRAELDIGAMRDYACRLDVDRAVVEGRLSTKAAKHDFTAFVSKTRHILCVRIKKLPKRARFKLRPLMEICPAMAGLEFPPPEFFIRELNKSGQLESGRPPPVDFSCVEPDRGKGTPAPGKKSARREKSDACGNIHIMTQTIPDGLCYALAWTFTEDDVFIAMEVGDTVAVAANRAAATLATAVRIGFEKLYREHTRAWEKIWSASAVMLPEKEAEFYWYYGVYLLASSARRGHLPPGLQGLWAMDGVLPPWRGDYHNDMNVQETFWPALVSGHLDLLDCWCDYMLERLPAVEAYTRRVFGTEGAFWPCTLFGKAAPGGADSVYYALFNFSWSHGVWLGWLVWLRWRYSLDAEWLRETGYPLLGGIFKFFRANLARESDGLLHVPLSSSPEYHGHIAREAFCKDPNIDLALIRRCCDWIMEMESALGIGELSADAKKIKAQLAPYALTDKQELCLWPGKPMDESHRHPSHLMALHPAMDLTIEGDEQEQKIIVASVLQFLALGRSGWAGHTYAQLISMAAVLGCAGWAYDSLRQFMEHWTMPNGLHVNADWRGSGTSSFAPLFGQNSYRTRAKAPFTMEANNAVSAGIGDMLVQGWGDKVRVFPAMPEHWREAAFLDLRTEGAFKVSAVRRQGRTTWVRVMATCARQLRLRDPFDGAAVTITGGAVRHAKDLYIADLRAHQTLEFRLAGVPFDWKEAVQAVRDGDISLLGLPATFGG